VVNNIIFFELFLVKKQKISPLTALLRGHVDEDGWFLANSTLIQW